MRKVLVTAAVMLLASFGLAAQSERLPVAVKLPVPTSVADSLHKFDVSFDYSIFNRPYTDLYDFTPHEAVRLETVGPNRTPIFYAKVGAQYPLMPNAELYLQSKNKNGFGIGLYGRHNSFIGTVPDVTADGKTDVRKMDNTVGGGLTYDWETGECMFDVKYGYDTFNYKSEGVNPYGRKSDISMTANFNSAYVEDNSLYYDITGGYTHTSFTHTGDSLSALKESYIHVNGYVGASFEIHRVYVNMNIEFANYSGIKNYSAGIVEFSPLYEYSRKFISAKIGAKFGSSFGIAKEKGDAGNPVGAKNSIFPDVDARLTILRKALWLHAVVSGGNDLNPFSKLTRECRMLMPQTELLAGKRDVDARLSLESLIGGRLSLNLLGAFTLYTDKLIYCPVMDMPGPKPVKAGYVSPADWSFGAELFWKSSDLTLGGKATYHNYSDRKSKERVTELPAFMANAFLRYNFRERLIASLDVNYRSKVSGSMYGYYEVPSIIDANVDINFIVNRHFSVFAKCGNILDRRNQYVPLYVEPGRNYGGGICVIF